MRFIGLKLLKDFLGKEDEKDKDLLTALIEQVSLRFETYTHRQFEALARTKFFDAGKRNYLLPAFPIDLGETLTVTVQDEVQVKDTDYFVWDDEGRIEFRRAARSTRFSSVITDPVFSTVLPRAVQIDWTGGFELNATEVDVLDVPEDIKHACLLQTAFQYRRRNDVGVSSLSLPDGNVSVLSPTALLPEVRAILDSYKLLRI